MLKLKYSAKKQQNTAGKIWCECDSWIISDMVSDQDLETRWGDRPTE